MKIKIFIIIALLTLITGCYNYHELNQLAITTGIGIDKGKDKNYKVTVQVLNTKKSAKEKASSDIPEFVIYESEANTIQEALRQIILESSKRIYANHMQVMVIGDEQAKSGIKDILDVFFRNSDSRKQFQVVVAKNTTAQNILSILTPLEEISAQKIIETIKADNRYLGVNEKITFEELVSDYLDETKEIVLPTVSLIGNAKEGISEDNLENTKAKTTIKNDSMALFKEDKLIDYLSKDDSILLNLIRGKIKNTIITSKCENNKNVVIEMFNTKEKIDTQINPLTLNVKIKADASINEITCDINIEDENEIKKLKNNIEEELNKKIETFIQNIIKEHKIDPFRIKNSLYKNYNKYYKENENNLIENLEKLKINVKSDIQIKEKGNALRVVKK